MRGRESGRRESGRRESGVGRKWEERKWEERRGERVRKGEKGGEREMSMNKHGQGKLLAAIRTRVRKNA